MDGKTVRLAKGNTSPFDPLCDGVAISWKTEGAFMQKSEKRQRTKIINFRVLPEEFNLFQQRCQASGISKSDYFRQKCLEGKPLRKRKVPNTDTAALLHLLGQIGRLGNNLNQIAKETNMGYTPINRDIEIELKELARLRNEIRKALNHDY